MGNKATKPDTDFQKITTKVRESNAHNTVPATTLLQPSIRKDPEETFNNYKPQVPSLKPVEKKFTMGGSKLSSSQPWRLVTYIH